MTQVAIKFGGCWWCGSNLRVVIVTLGVVARDSDSQSHGYYGMWLCRQLGDPQREPMHAQFWLSVRLAYFNYAVQLGVVTRDFNARTILWPDSGQREPSQLVQHSDMGTNFGLSPARVVAFGQFLSCSWYMLHNLRSSQWPYEPHYTIMTLHRCQNIGKFPKPIWAWCVHKPGFERFSKKNAKSLIC